MIFLRHGYTCTLLWVHAEIIVAIALCWLAGGWYLDLKNMYCYSVCTVYVCRLHYIFLCCELVWFVQFKFPTTCAKNWCAQIQFHQISFISLQVVVLVQLMVCLLSISVYLRRISTITPYLTTSAITVVMAWNSSDMWFLLPLSFLGEAAPEKHCIQAAIECTSLSVSLDSIPIGSYVVIGAAYA